MTVGIFLNFYLLSTAVVENHSFQGYVKPRRLYIFRQPSELMTVAFRAPRSSQLLELTFL